MEIKYINTFEDIEFLISIFSIKWDLVNINILFVLLVLLVEYIINKITKFNLFFHEHSNYDFYSVFLVEKN